MVERLAHYLCVALTTEHGGPVVSLSTDAVPARDRLDWWRCMMESDVMPVELRNEHTSDFAGKARMAELPGMRVAEFSFTPLTATRTPTQIRRLDPEQYLLILVQGSPIQLEQSRSTVHLTSGSLALCSTSYPMAADFFSRDHRRHRVALMVLPRTSLPLPGDRMNRLLGASLATRSPAGWLLGQFLSGFLSSVGHGGPAELRRTGAIGVDLAAAYLAGLLDADDLLPVETREQVLLARVDAFIDHNLADPELDPAAIAAHHHISVRTLHQVFRSRPETVGATIRRRRLERCRADLTDPSQRHRTIGAIAIRWGFRHPADLSRAFRSAYGVPPSKLRGGGGQTGSE
ncbi:helix-turn-helix domain-containing protein [Kitasatospora aureofaciens]|uniref:helix-turn-helix domain-containing protein n=1 Tax=Kitasatospora aureofaciens TaxID=1894 RepID=UPI00068943E3|nr:helix-turn-helix domain-containing protein [Kitasatospora aureofaciens]